MKSGQSKVVQKSLNCQNTLRSSGAKLLGETMQ